MKKKIMQSPFKIPPTLNKQNKHQSQFSNLVVYFSKGLI